VEIVPPGGTKKHIDSRKRARKLHNGRKKALRHSGIGCRSSFVSAGWWTEADVVVPTFPPAGGFQIKKALQLFATLFLPILLANSQSLFG